MTSLVSEYSPLSPALAERFELLVPRGFVMSSEVCGLFVAESGLQEKLDELYSGIDRNDPNDVMLKSFGVRKIFDKVSLPTSLTVEIEQHYHQVADGKEETDLVLFARGNNPLTNATRVNGCRALLKTLHKTLVEHLTNGIISKFENEAFDYIAQAPDLIVQVSAPCESSGLALSYEPQSKARNFVVVFSTWGIAEDLVRRTVSRDEYFYHKAGLEKQASLPVHSRCGDKEFQFAYDFEARRLVHTPLSRHKSRSYSLTEEGASHLARLLHELEKDTEDALEITWAGSGESLTVLSIEHQPQPPSTLVQFFRQTGDGPLLVRGRAVGHSVATGRVRILRSRDDLEDFRPGEVLVAEKTQPDWEPAFRKAAAIVTEKDRRVSHSTILAREMGRPAILEAIGCSTTLRDGQLVTVSCCKTPDGRVLAGEVAHDVEEYSLHRMPEQKPQLMVNLSMPERALSAAQLPWAGAGLVRSEFMIGSRVKIHPLALLHPERLPDEGKKAVERLIHGYENGTEYFLQRMSQAIAMIAAAFYPRPVTLRFSDFKSEEYARLLGGETFEPQERNSMLGWRGASRYLHPDYRAAFCLELEAVRRVRDEMGLTNLKTMIPFCRTPEEGEEIIYLMEEAGLKRGLNGLEIWAMAELPSNVFLAGEFASIFDGISIGSSDLTALTMGVDRNSDRLAEYFDELHPALMQAYEMILEATHREGKMVSFCGQGASEDPEFVALLAEMGLDIVSLAPDVLSATLERLTGRPS